MYWLVLIAEKNVKSFVGIIGLNKNVNKIDEYKKNLMIQRYQCNE